MDHSITNLRRGRFHLLDLDILKSHLCFKLGRKVHHSLLLKLNKVTFHPPQECNKAQTRKLKEALDQK